MEDSVEVELAAYGRDSKREGIEEVKIVNFFLSTSVL